MHIMFDTLAVTKKLEEQGLLRARAEKIVEMLRDNLTNFWITKEGDEIQKGLNYNQK